jgi:hypothetical protein
MMHAWLSVAHCAVFAGIQTAQRLERILATVSSTPRRACDSAVDGNADCASSPNREESRVPQCSKYLIVPAILFLFGCATPSSDQTRTQPGETQAKIEQIQNAETLIYVAKQRDILQNGSDPSDKSDTADKPDALDKPEEPNDDGKN